MRHVQIGGWTRVWLCMSALFLVAAIFGYRSEIQYAKEKSDQQYKTEIAGAEACDAERKRGAPKSTGAFDSLIYQDCLSGTDAKEDFAAAERAANQRRAIAMSAGQDEALSYGLHLFLWPTVTLALFLIAVGWIRAGFARRPVR